MILYLDTSALVKLYAEEAGSADVRRAVEAATFVVTATIAYVEIRAALARKRRLRQIDDPTFSRCKRDLERDWTRLERVEITRTLIRRAADLAEDLGLRGYDSLHLAAADRLRSIVQEPITFACFDRGLNRAAVGAGFEPLLPRR